MSSVTLPPRFDSASPSIMPASTPERKLTKFPPSQSPYSRPPMVVRPGLRGTPSIPRYHPYPSVNPNHRRRPTSPSSQYLHSYRHAAPTQNSYLTHALAHLGPPRRASITAHHAPHGTPTLIVPRPSSEPPNPLRNKQLARQLAAETLLAMDSAPVAKEFSSAEVPPPAALSREKSDEDGRGAKRKLDETVSSRSAAGSSHSNRNLPQSSATSGPRPQSTTDNRSGQAPPMTTSTSSAPATHGNIPGRTSQAGASSHSPSIPPGEPAGPSNQYNRYGAYVNGSRDPHAIPWSLSANRYGLGAQRGPPSSHNAQLGAAAPKSTQIPSAPLADPLARHRPAIPPHLSGNPVNTSTPGALRELHDHREHLREGKKWLEKMMTQTERLLYLVDNKLASDPAGSGSAASAIAALGGRSVLAGGGRHAEDWEFEERERNRAREIQRIEDDRRRDRLEREKRQKDRDDDVSRDRSLPQTDPAALDRARAGHHLGERDPRPPGFGGGFFGTWGSGLGREREWETMREREKLAREKDTKERDMVRNESEKNRDLLLASRRVTAVSPIPSTGAGRAGSIISAGVGGGNRSTSNSPAIASRSLNTSSGSSGPAPKPSLGWDGEPIMAGTALPRSQQAPLNPYAAVNKPHRSPPLANAGIAANGGSVGKVSTPSGSPVVSSASVVAMSPTISASGAASADGSGADSKSQAARQGPASTNGERVVGSASGVASYGGQAGGRGPFNWDATESKMAARE